MKKKEFSKKIIIVYAIIEITVIVFSCIMMWRTDDLSPLAYLIPSVSIVSSTNIGAYYSKAKLENKIKLMKANHIEITDEVFNENNY